MAQATPTLAPELVARIQATATAHYTDIKANATAEQLSAFWERQEKYNNDSEFKATAYARLTSDYNESDADQDGKLNLAEFKAFMLKNNVKQREAGCYARDLADGELEEMFNDVNAVAEGDGVTMQDFIVYMGSYMTKFYMMRYEMPGDKEAIIQQIAETRYNEMVANGSAEEQATYWDAIKKMQDPLNSEFRDARYALMTEQWNAADADQDGRLNADEFRVFFEADKKTRADKGFYVGPADDCEAMYGCMNTVTEGEGCVMMDYLVVLGNATMKM